MSRRRLSVLFTPAEIDPVLLADRVTVVADVLRSTSVVPVALAHGAAEIYPTSSVADARALRETTPGALLGGEDAGRKPAGFDFGNSPLEYTRE
ncbi:MAG TPA: 2-phosphosulfolactate phosphatase, partial [Candidatus Eisenbacteria bacterium]|nr:2-phosphosulfolactate phosphatase [Candidatus Eisenbacteria bacterium]